MLWTFIAIILIILFFPIRWRLNLQGHGEGEYRLQIWLWTFCLYDSAKSDQEADQASSTDPANPSNTEADNASEGRDREWWALALHSQLHRGIWKLVRLIWRRFRKIFRVRIPVLNVQYGFENPAQTGMYYGYFMSAKAVLPFAKKWDFQPRWGVAGLGNYQLQILVGMNLFRIMLFLMATLFAVIRFLLLLRKLKQNYAKDPRSAGLPPLRRWILDLIMPHPQEENHDPA